MLLLSLVFPLGGSKNHAVLPTMLNDPLWTLASDAALWFVAPIPRAPLLTLTTGRVLIPNDTSVASFIVPSGKLDNPTCSIFIYSSSIFNTSLGWTELMPLRTNCDVAAPILLVSVCSIAVYVIGCCTIPSRPITVLLSFFTISMVWALPDPSLVNVIGFPEVM